MQNPHEVISKVEMEARYLIARFVRDYSLMHHTSLMLGGNGMPQVGMNLGTAVRMNLLRVPYKGKSNE